MQDVATSARAIVANAWNEIDLYGLLHLLCSMHVIIFILLGKSQFFMFLGKFPRYARKVNSSDAELLFQ